ncbi:MAG: bile acid:sodium symporter [Candidatus Magasanikbacteria bacterium]
MKFTQKYFGLIIIFSLVIGLLCKSPGLFFKEHLILILGVMMALSSLKIDMRELKHVRSEWWKYVVVLVCVFGLFPLLSLLVRPFLNDQYYIGLLLVVAVPCAVSVVFLSDFLGGDPSKALVSTTLAHLFSPFVMPFIIWMLAHKDIGVDVIGMMWFIAKIIIIPFVIAQIIRTQKKWHDTLVPFSNSVNTYLLFILIWGMTAPVSHLLFTNAKQVLIMLVISIFIVCIAVCVAFVFGRNKKERITWAICMMYRNLGLSSAIAFTMFNSTVALVPVVYTFVGNAAIAIMQWKTGKNVEGGSLKFQKIFKFVHSKLFKN